MLGPAIFSKCGTWRYRLEREIGLVGQVAAIIGVNPSTATETINDQTISKDIGFATRLHWSRIIKGNLFAYRATDVRELRTASDPIGPDNNDHLEQIMRDADIVVAAWGTRAKLPARLRTRWRDILRIADHVGKPLMCWGTTDDDSPCHPARLPYRTELGPWPISDDSK